MRVEDASTNTGWGDRRAATGVDLVGNLAHMAHENLPDGWTNDWLKWNVNLVSVRASEDEVAELPYISNEDIASWTGELLREPKSEEAVDARLFRTGDVLFNKLRPYLAKAYLAKFDGVSSGELLCLRPSGRVSSRYLFYYVSSYRLIEMVNAATFGAKMPRADWNIVGHQSFSMPARSQQERIADYLDERTVRIDGLIARKERLLELLAEKRQALITRTVTKGLDPDASMKPSGIDWLGDIPEHWEVMPVKRVAELESGHTPDRKVDEYWTECSIPWVSLNDTANLRQSDYITDTKIKINELGLSNSSARMLPPRAVVFTRDATIGECAITLVPMAVAQHIIAWLCNTDRIVPEYLLFLIYGMKGELLRLTNGATIGTIGMTDVKSLRVSVPPLLEQKAVVAFVAETKVSIDISAEVIASSIGALKEYRSALITAAVTGQLEMPHD